MSAPATRSSIRRVVELVAGARGWPPSSVRSILADIEAQPYPDGSPLLADYAADAVGRTGWAGSEKAEAALRSMGSHAGGSHADHQRAQDPLAQAAEVVTSSASDLRGAGQQAAQVAASAAPSLLPALGLAAALALAFRFRS